MISSNDLARLNSRIKLSCAQNDFVTSYVIFTTTTGILAIPYVIFFHSSDLIIHIPGNNPRDSAGFRGQNLILLISYAINKLVIIYVTRDERHEKN